MQENLYHLLFWIAGAVCHQKPERSLAFHDVSLPFCARCTGIYVTIFIMAAVLAVFGKTTAAVPNTGRRQFITGFALAIISMLPLEIDGIGNLLGLWRSEAVIRIITGCAMGFGLPVIFLCIIGYELTTGGFTPPVSQKTLFIAGIAAAGATAAVYNGLPDSVVLWGIVSVMGLVIMLSAFVYLPLTKMVGLRGRGRFIVCVGVACGLLCTLNFIKTGILRI